MGSGVQRMLTGKVVGTGSLLSVRTIGFRPSRVELVNETGLVSAEWQDSMADGDMYKRVTGGTLSKVTTDGVTPLSDGFSLGADADVNVSDEEVHWAAYE